MLRSLVSLYSILSLADIATSQYTTNAEAAFKQLQTWYNTSSGLWSTTGWWNAANCLTVIGDLAAIDSSVKSTVTGVMSNTFTQAQTYNLQMTKVVMVNYNYLSIYGNDTGALNGLALAGNIPVQASTTVNPQGFLNDFYDDEGWWALGWIQAYDVTGNSDYLTMAEDIFADMKNATTTPCSNGARLYLSVSAHLANRATGSDKANYLTIAKNQWNWFKGTGMINSQGTINDGLTNSSNNGLSVNWAGPFVATANASTESSALDALVAAAAIGV
ncbi:hypothetical protein EYC84_007065 [Monilinia fructicola]|uniref:Mannan endo-1,6-alpha-mannosidase n=1 Tax=Monilinia fructicola TaxID=38448 RepID=A0A5M9K5E7_MONFR|nr:hypothetical protein EYC84_007065 [Monilinia fructicola]